MKLLSYRSGRTTSFGVVSGDGVIDAVALLNGAATSVRELLERDLVTRLAEAAVHAPITHSLRDVEYLPPLPDPGKLLCVGVYYADHREETGQADVPQHPTI